MPRLQRFLLFLSTRFLPALFACAVASQSHASPTRVVSGNVCGDQLLIHFTTPERILALGPFAHAEDISFYADRAHRFPTTTAAGEELIRLKPDLVLLGAYDSRYTRLILGKRGIPFVLLDSWDDLVKMRAGVLDVGERLGERARSIALLREIELALGELAQVRTAISGRYSALILQRRGYVMGEGILHDVIRRSGLRDAAGELGMTSSGFVDLEKIVRLNPDYLVVDSLRAGASDQGAALLQHPALERLYPPERRLVIPEVLTVCGGPPTPALIDTLREQIEHKVLPRLG